MRARVSIAAVALLAAACATGESAPSTTTAPPSSTTTTTTTLPPTTTTTTAAPTTTTTPAPALDVADVAGEGPPCANITALDNTARPVYTNDCPVTAAAWPDADYRVKGRTGVLGWLVEDDPDGFCGIPGAYYQCYNAPMRAVLGGVLLETGQTTVVAAVWKPATGGYEWTLQELWTATFYLGDHPESGEPIVGEFLLSSPGQLQGTDPNAAGWRVCLNGNLLASSEVSCLQAPNRQMPVARMVHQVLEVGRAYAFSVFYTFDPNEAFAAIPSDYTADTGAWGHIVDTWVDWVTYSRDLRDQVQGEAPLGLPPTHRGLILDVILDEIPQELV